MDHELANIVVLPETLVVVVTTVKPLQQEAEPFSLIKLSCFEGSSNQRAYLSNLFLFLTCLLKLKQVMLAGLRLRQTDVHETLLVLSHNDGEPQVGRSVKSMIIPGDYNKASYVLRSHERQLRLFAMCQANQEQTLLTRRSTTYLEN